MAMVLDGAANLYIDDFLNSRVIKAVPTGSGNNYVVNQLVTDIQSPTGIAVDGNGDVFFTAPDGLDKIYMLANDVPTVQMLGSGFSGPGAVGVDGVGDVYVLDSYSVMWIERPTGSGGYSQEQLIPLDTNFPPSQPGSAIAVDSAGNVWAMPKGGVANYALAAPPSDDFSYDEYGVVATGLTWGLMDLGNEPLDLTQITFSANYLQEPGKVDVTFPTGVSPVGDCKSGETLSGSQYCTISAEFLPSTPLNGQNNLPVNGDITLVSNAPVSPEQIALSGIEQAPYPPTALLTTSADPSVAGQTVTLTATLIGTSIPPSGSVSFMTGTAGNVTTSLATVSLNSKGVATYTVNGLTTGTYYYQVTYPGDAAYPSSSSAVLTQAVVPAPGVGNFGDTTVGKVNVGSSSATIPLMISFTQAETLGAIAVVTDGVPNLDYQNPGGGTCTAGKTYAANATCTVNVVFKPRLAGLRRGAVVLTDASGNVIGTGYLAGIGVGPQAAFGPGAFGPVSGVTLGANELVSDGNGNIYLGAGDGNLYELTRGSGGYAQTKVLSAPVAGIAVDGAGNLFLMVGPLLQADVVTKETPSAGGGFSATAVGTASGPQAIAVDGGGNLYIADRGAQNQVLKESPSDGDYTESTIGSGWVTPEFVATDAAGDVYIFDSVSTNDAEFGNLYKAVPESGGYTVSKIASPQYQVGAMSADTYGDVYLLETDFGASTTTYVIEETPQSDGSYVPSTVLKEVGNFSQSTFAIDPLGNVFLPSSSLSGDSLAELDVADAPALTFATTAKGVTSADSPQVVTVNNVGNAALDFSAVSFPADFPEASGTSGDCSAKSKLAAGTACTLTIDFSPESDSPGTLGEAVSFTANPLNASGTKTSIAVSGTETIPSLTVTATAVTVAPGATSGNTSKVTLTPGGGFTGNVTLTAAVTTSPAGAQDLPTLSVTSPASITGTGAATATLTIDTTAPTTAQNRDSREMPGWLAGGGVFAVLVCFSSRWRRLRWVMALSALAVVCLVTSCGGGSNAGGGGGGRGGNPGTTPGSYIITVNATAGSATANCTMTLTVQ